MPLRCLIVDDSAHFLEAARSVLERDAVNVVGVASTVADAVQRADQLRPDVVLVDVDLGEESGFTLAREFAGRPPVILISAHDASDFADLVAESPAAGFISKSELSGRAIENLLGA